MAVDEPSRWFYEKRADEARKNLIKHGFEAIKVHTAVWAVDEIMRRISPAQTVGAGGSVTLREIGVLEKLQEQGNVIYDHWKQGLSKGDSLGVRKLQQSCDVFLTGANAVTLSGEIVNIDGFGNRISSMVFGPKEVMIVAGYNKLVRDIPEAVHRIKTLAAPMNARRFGADTPCARMGKCMDCDSPQRICRGTLIMERRPFATPTTVILVMEDLGY
jgi:hypothetical protein